MRTRWPFCFISYLFRSRKTHNRPLPCSWCKRYLQAVLHFFSCSKRHQATNVRVVPHWAGRTTDYSDVQNAWWRTCSSRGRNDQFLFKSCRSVVIFLQLQTHRNLILKPIDPIFYLHHANLDRIWWNWQQTEPNIRLYEVSGRSTITPPFQNITLDFGLEMGGFAPITPIRQVMDIHSEPMCYTYV